MNYSVLTIPTFERQAKRLAKKFPSLKSDLSALIASLTEHPEQGTPLGNGFFKIRLAIASKGKGKSGGARVITYVKVIQETVYLTTLYDKSDKDTLSNHELEQIFKELPE